MAVFVLRRLLASVPVLFGCSVVVFALVATGDPLADLRSRPNVPASTIELRTRELHLDEPLPVRYALWGRGLLQGDLGRSVNGEEVASILGRAAPLTARLMVAAVAMALVGSVVMGSASALWRYSWFDHAGTVVAFVLLSLPVIWLSGVLIDVGSRVNRALGTTLFYVVGARSPFDTGGFLSTLADRAGHLVLPAATLALLLIGEWSRFLRSSMVEELSADYVRTARAKGMSQLGVVRDALRNGLVPLVPVASLSIGRLIGGALVTERVFSWRGMGDVLLTGLRASDANVVMGWLLIAAAAVIICNLLSDVAGAWLDPRVRGG